MIVIHGYIPVCFKLLQDGEYSSVYYIVSPCLFSMLYIIVCILYFNPKLLVYPSAHLVTMFVFYVCESIVAL